MNFRRLFLIGAIVCAVMLVAGLLDGLWRGFKMSDAVWLPLWALQGAEMLALHVREARGGDAWGRLPEARRFNAVVALNAAVLTLLIAATGGVYLLEVFNGGWPTWASAVLVACAVGVLVAAVARLWAMWRAASSAGWGRAAVA